METDKNPDPALELKVSGAGGSVEIPLMTQEEFKLFQQLVYRICGIFLRDYKQDMVASRILKRVRSMGMSSFAAYYNFVSSPHGREEIGHLLSALTINETSFFRNAPQFELLKKRVLPELIEKKKKAGRLKLRIWSAGCSTGQEPYSIAIVLLETLKNLAGWDVRILGSDISFESLEIAQRGVYPESKVEKIDPVILRTYFEKRGNEYRVCDTVRRLVQFDYHNLMNDKGLRNLDIVFCRNVTIYFDNESLKKLLDIITRSLSPGGYLFIGHSETLFGVSSDFDFIYQDRGTAYRKKIQELENGRTG